MDEAIENRVEIWGKRCLEVKAKEIEVNDDEEIVIDWLLVNIIIFMVMVSSYLYELHKTRKEVNIAMGF